MKRLFSLMVFIFVSAEVSAQEQDMLAFDMDHDVVNISSDFTGERLVVFGMKEDNEGQLKIVVEGPRKNMVVRRKEQVLGAWINKASERFNNVPVFFDYAVFNFDQRLPLEDEVFNETKASEAFQKSLIRNKQKEKLYPDEPKQIMLHSNNKLFRVDFKLPANVPVGEYMVKAIYRKDGEVHEDIDNFNVVQTGINSAVQSFSKEQGFLYGTFCIILALSAGWFSNKVRRRP